MSGEDEVRSNGMTDREMRRQIEISERDRREEKEKE